MRLICGMHRSGTSLVAAIAHAAGGDFGDEAGFYPADRWNPGGYFEQEEIHAINMPLINGPWGRAAYFRLPSDRTIAKRAQRLAPQMEILADRYQDRVVKENRFCLTLRAWRAHGAKVEQLLVVFRNPHAVADSLWRRNRIPRFLAFSLWLEHYRRLFRHAEGIPRAVLWYDRLVENEEGAATECAKIAWLLQQESQPVTDAAHASIRFGRRAEKDGRKLSAGVRQMYDELKRQSDMSP